MNGASIHLIIVQSNQEEKSNLVINIGQLEQVKMIQKKSFFNILTSLTSMCRRIMESSFKIESIHE